MRSVIAGSAPLCGAHASLDQQRCATEWRAPSKDECAYCRCRGDRRQPAWLFRREVQTLSAAPVVPQSREMHRDPADVGVVTQQGDLVRVDEGDLAFDPV